MKVHVTGGGGYVSSHPCRPLQRVRHKPVIFANLHTDRWWAVQPGPLVKGHTEETDGSCRCCPTLRS